MPFSAPDGKQFIRDVLNNLNPRALRVLDVGAGAGSLLKRYRRNGQYWHAVEIWPPYVDKYKLDEIYQELTVADARELEYGENTYDVAFAGDVLEHMEPQQAAELLAKLRRAAPVVIVSIPIGPYPQGAYEGNIFETHVKDDWQVQDVFHILGVTNEFSVNGPVGTFVYRRQQEKLRICVYGISKNEEQFVDTFCESARDADVIVIADTGSTDGTVAKLHARRDEHGQDVRVHHIAIIPWRFDMARNAAIALLPTDVDVCISLDLDERLEPGWREEIERLWVKGVTTRMRYKFDWGHGIKFDYEKTHSRGGYHWHHPCHEYPRTDPRTVEKLAVSDKLLVTHHPDPTKSRGQYMAILEVAVAEDPHCPRNAFYYGRELVYNGRQAEAIVALQRYLALPAKLWENEKAYAMRLIGDCMKQTGRLSESYQWYVKGTFEAPWTREPWFALAQYHYEMQDWPSLFAATSRLFSIKNREDVYTCDPEVWGWKPHDLHALAAYHLKMYDLAIEHGKLACEHAPDDARLKTNQGFYEAARKG